MASIPPNLGRTSTALSPFLLRSNLQQTNVALLRKQIELSTGLKINRPSDEAESVGKVSFNRTAIELFDQRLRDLQNVAAMTDVTDVALGDVGDLLLEANGIALSQIGITAVPDTRDALADVIDNLIDAALETSNRQFQDLHLFAGRQSSTVPFVEQFGGIRYVGSRENLTTNLSEGNTPVDINSNGADAFGALSGRVIGTVDLDPNAVATTRLRDVDGARNRGVTLGSIDLAIGALSTSIDLTGLDSLQDVAAAVTAGINGLIAGAGSLTVSANGFTLTSAGAAITLSDFNTGVTAQDLGINITAAAGSTVGADLNPRIRLTTNVSDLATLGAGDLAGGLKITNGTVTKVVSLATATTVEDLINAVANADLGVRLEISQDGDSLDLVNEVSGLKMSIGENAGGTTATALGLRTFTSGTLLADFNNGLGVRTQSGVDDIRIELHDGTQIDVNLDGAVTAQDVIDAVTAAAGAAPLTIAFVADGNGLTLADASVGAGSFRIVRLNNSLAADDLGLFQDVGAAGTLTGTDVATVQVDSVFTHLMNLRDALRNNDERAITLAGGALDADFKNIATVRAKTGVRAQRIELLTTRTQDQKLQTQTLLSSIQDTDYTEAISKFTQLQQQLEANLMSASSLMRLSLLDFLR
jgi:flagellar hook-associated protein 3 FlgL